ncbi:branched-chain amino acid ABC transporter substrate-binding protein [Pukyongiella litopenaei]|uniref:Branched-chain amino acid ABC transporter substrate-binding protein n=2 Tax=Pukyongiella litopenaei TaxID=2605946 RepID=A0A2S0MV39_9RHOB|nr:ABC transporter substrate-binding protein [Pukyongiella litopenaei]AVO39756.1 branched-chain amino acid ABC transporter substrate-binding protein [Pukyongiella litopenaei]
MRWMICLGFLVLSGPALAELSLPVGYLERQMERPPVLSNLDPVPHDLGAAGAALGIDDNRTTGQFLGHGYELDTVRVAPGEDVVAAAARMLEQTRFLVIDAPAADLLAIADLPEAQGAILFNASAPDTSLREGDCRGNLFHTIPSAAMRADALLQFLQYRRWTALAMISGPHDADVAFADALRRAAVKFGMEIGVEQTWSFDADMRRNAAQEVPLFTQDLGDHDVLLVVDERDDYARYIPYNTWLPRPVAGSDGIVPVAWSRVVEQWGAAQLQGRFSDAAGRDMRSVDYAAWAAVRALGEAVTRTGSDDPATLRAFLLSDAFELAGFKGRPLSFRAWNGQLRQPIPLVTSRALVAQAPLDGFLHQHNEMDTLGIDAPESTCTRFED